MPWYRVGDDNDERGSRALRSSSRRRATSRSSLRTFLASRFPSTGYGPRFLRRPPQRSFPQRLPRRRQVETVQSLAPQQRSDLPRRPAGGRLVAFIAASRSGAGRVTLSIFSTKSPHSSLRPSLSTCTLFTNPKGSRCITDVGSEGGVRTVRGHFVGWLLARECHRRVSSETGGHNGHKARPCPVESFPPIRPPAWRRGSLGWQAESSVEPIRRSGSSRGRASLECTDTFL